MGLGASLQDINPEPLMSALGQKQTLDCCPPMSALPRKADIALYSITSSARSLLRL
jgi:hypothetical protein